MQYFCGPIEKNMKKIKIGTLVFSLFLLAASCDQKNGGEITSDMISNSATATDKDIPTSAITFDQDTFDFGTVVEGEKVAHAFTFTNTGKHDLIISKALGSCGCTVPDWPKQPIKPGEKASIDVVFNSDRRIGKAMKDVTVYANTEPSTNKVVITGFVKGDPSEE
jgi:hypothetical protein